MPDVIPPTADALAEALRLSEEILTDIELSRIPLSNIALKAGRLARLVNEFDYHRIMDYEVSGFPTKGGMMTQDDWRLAGLANRYYTERDEKTKEDKTYAFLESIGQLEQEIEAARLGVEAARDPDVSISSANPHQFVHAPPGNLYERRALRNSAAVASNRLASRRAFLHQYVSSRYYELRFSNAASDVFSRVREQVDVAVATIIPDAVKRFSSAHENLRSENPEDWSNAVHSCRRVLQDLADAVFPPTTEERVVREGDKQVTVKLGPDQYKNRIIAFVVANSASNRYTEIVGSHLKYLGERLDAVFDAAQKGSHSTIVRREEADRYVVFTYMLVGDILALKASSPTGAS